MIMKKILFALLITLFITATTKAQTFKGDWLVGGGLSLNTTSNTTIGIYPNGGYFFADNFAAGANVNINYQKTGNNKRTDLGIGPFARYYFGKKNIKPFAQVELSVLSTKDKIGSISSTLNGTNFFIGPGIAAFVNENVAIETIAGYSHTKYKNFDGDGGLAVRIGFQVYLHPKRIVETFKGN
jgi:Outer membrane protein beta-barrel domain